MISVTNLHKNFQSFPALKGVNLNVRKGEIYGFIGQNGAGKSTTMNILAGLSHPTTGTCVVNGQDVTKIRRPSDLDIGYLPEDPKFYPWMNARETFGYLGNSAGKTVSRSRIDEMIGWVGLTESANRRVGGFSRGMKQRLGIGAALIHDPGLLILDEPSSALDPEGRSDVLQLIKDLKQMGKTVFFSSHILNDVERVCDTIGMIASGIMVMEKPLVDIQKDNLIPIYDIECQAPASAAMIQSLRQLDGVQAVTGKDLEFSITMSGRADDANRLMCFFCEQGVALRSFTLHKNTLEDIFIQEVNGK